METVRCTGCGATLSLRRASRPAASTAVPAPARASRPTARPSTFNPLRGSGSTSNWKKALISLIVVGAFGAVVHPATFATFSASVTNPAAITTGTLVLSSANPTSGTCLSVGAGTTITSTNSFNCATSFLNIPQSNLVPTPSATTNLPIYNGMNILTISNVGTLTANTVQMYAAAACTAAAGASTYKGANVGTSVGLCAAMDIVIYEATSAAGTTMTTNGCIYGNKAGTGSVLPVAGCTFDKNTLAAPAPGVQPAYSFTMADFGTCHLLVGSVPCNVVNANYPAGPVTLLNAAGAANLTLAPAASTYIVVDVSFPDTGDQSIMGTVGTLNLTFQIGE